MKRFLKYIVIRAVILIALLDIISFALVHALNKSRFYKSFAIHNDVNVKKTKIVILGSSRALTGIDTKMLEDSLGLPAYNLGMDDSKLSIHRVFLEELLRQGGHPETLILVYDNPIDTSETSSNEHRIFPLMHSSPYAYSYMKTHHNILKRYAYNYFPFLYFGKYSSDLFFPALTAMIKPDYIYRADTLGDYVYPASRTMETHYFDSLRNNKKDIKLSCINPDLLAIGDSCASNHIRLIIYMAPTAGQNRIFRCRSNYEVVDATSIMDSMPQCFVDYVHVNANGRRIATQFLISHLRNKNE